MALMRGCHPEDGSLLRSITKASTVAAVDLTFSARDVVHDRVVEQSGVDLTRQVA
jgi:hypothetical protein